ncbi:MAG: hypothetical protein VX899_03005 [Myxococcota bacterium]|nr:hypothetical protein [Myxococcota bacterium]
MTLLTLALSLSLACKDGDTATDDSQVEGDADSDADTDSDTDTDAPVSDAAGTVETRTDPALSADIAIVKAFSYSTDKKTFIYASSNPAASCDLLTDVYDPEKGSQDLTDLFLPGHCNVSITLVGAPPIEDYDIKNGDGSAVANIACTIGEGAWEYSGSGADSGYFWTGDYYTGSAFKETLSIAWEDQASGQLHATLKLGGYNGTLSDTVGEVDAQGYIKGEVYTVECEGLSGSGGF